MKQTGTDVNRIVLHGRAVHPPALSHCNHEVEFFSFPLVVSRLSGEVFGSCLTFGALRAASAPGQIDAGKLKQVLEVIHQAL